MFFEPEGGYVELERGQSITVEIDGGAAFGAPEIAYLPAGIMVAAWPGAVTTAWDADGRRLNI